jgi:hypothetical protein
VKHPQTFALVTEESKPCFLIFLSSCFASIARNSLESWSNKIHNLANWELCVLITQGQKQSVIILSFQTSSECLQCNRFHSCLLIQRCLPQQAPLCNCSHLKPQDRHWNFIGHQAKEGSWTCTPWPWLKREAA